MKSLPELKPEWETVSLGPRVIFWSASQKHHKTTMMKLAANKQQYQQVTVRNFNTTMKLKSLLDRA
ncbi:MAG: hypothetical protein R3C03_08775 [Pirellulaceae bacterium]